LWFLNVINFFINVVSAMIVFGFFSH